MGDSDDEKSDQGETGMSQQEKDLEKKIKKEIDKLKFYLEEGNELLENCDYSEITVTCKRTDEIQDRLNDHLSTLRPWNIDAERGETVEKGLKGHIRAASGDENQTEQGFGGKGAKQKSKGRGGKT